jgi:hypothetical protein
MDSSPASNLVAIGTRDRVIKLIDFQHATLQVFVSRATAPSFLTAVQEHVAPLGTQELLAFSPDGSMLSCVSNAEVNYINRVRWSPLTPRSRCRFGRGTCADRLLVQLGGACEHRL